MAIGDDAINAGYAIVPNEGEDGKVRYGAREINRTRDYIAHVKNQIPSSNSSARIRAGISSGQAAPSGGSDGDIYFQIY